MTGTLTALTADQMLPDVLRQYPFLRPVFDRYGLRGCGGPLGPVETIGYFSRAHGVDPQRLLGELNAAVADPTRASPSPAAAAAEPEWLDRLADSIYRRFFKAGVVVILTAGAAWGALLLLRIGLGRSFTAISIHDINAHGHAQIFGWVGLFVMGFAYQAFPRMRHTSLHRPDLANMSFYLMVGGVFARAVGEPLHRLPLLRELAVAGGLAELAAIGIFIGVLLATIRRSGKAFERHDAYILAAMGFFLAQAAGDLALMRATTSAGSREELLAIVSTWQPPLRDLQIHGFAMLMILGVGIRMFPVMFGLAAPGPRLVRRCLVLLVAAVLGEAAFFVLLRQTADYRWAIPMYASMLLLAGASVGLTLRWGLLAHRPEKDRSVKFVRMAVAWLHTSMLLLALAPLYMRVLLPASGVLSPSGGEAVSIGFSHAYYGAVRHAITVGFISLTILGVAAKVVPTLNGVDIRRLGGLWPSFLLVNLGCAMRVGFQIATDFGEWAYPVAGVSGVLEVAGIAIWGVHLWRIMAGRYAPAGATALVAGRLTADDRIGHIVEQFPATLPVLVARGFSMLANPVLRRTLARTVSVRMAAAHHGMDAVELLAALNAAALADANGSASAPRPAGLALKVLSHA
jgi:hypothetical protein